MDETASQATNTDPATANQPAPDLIGEPLEAWLTENLNLDAETIQQLERLLAEVPAGPLTSLGLSVGSGVVASIVGLTITLAIAAVVYVLIAAIFAGFIWLPFRKVPRPYRKMSPLSVWLTAVPFLGLLWNFRVAGRVPASFQAYFTAHPDALAPPPGTVSAPLQVGTAGKGLGVSYAALMLASWLAPLTCLLAFLSMPLAVAAIVLYVLFVVKLFQLSERITQHRQAAKTTNPQPKPPIAPTNNTPDGIA